MERSDIYAILFYGVILIIVLYLVLALVRPKPSYRQVRIEQRPIVVSEASWWPWSVTSYSWWPYWSGWWSGGGEGGYNVRGNRYDYGRNEGGGHREDRPWGGAGREANRGAPGGGHGGGHGGHGR